MSSDIKKRIQILAQASGLSERKFSLSIGKSESFIRTIKDNVGSDTIRSIMQVYPHVNLYWLLLEEGNMFVSSSEVTRKVPELSELYLNSLKTQIRQLKEIVKTKDELISTLKKLPDFE